MDAESMQTLRETLPDFFVNGDPMTKVLSNAMIRCVTFFVTLMLK